MVYSPVCYAVFCVLRLSSTCAWELVNNSVSIASIAFVISSLTSQLSCRLKSPKTEEVAPESSFFPLQIISLFKLTCSMLPEARTTQYNRQNTSLLSLYRWKVMYLYFIFRMFPVVVMILLAFEEIAVDWIRFSESLQWLLSLLFIYNNSKAHAVSLPCCSPHSLPNIFVSDWDNGHLPLFAGVLPKLDTSVLFKKIRCIALSFELEYKKKKVGTTGSLSVFHKSNHFPFC